MPIQPGFIDRMGWQVKVALEWRGSQDEEDGIAAYSLPGKKFNLWMPSFEHARRDMQELLQGPVKAPACLCGRAQKMASIS